MGRTVAARHGYDIDPDRELIARGADSHGYGREWQASQIAREMKSLQNAGCHAVPSHGKIPSWQGSMTPNVHLALVDVEFHIDSKISADFAT